MKNTWRILAAVTALSLAACPGDDGGDGGNGTGSCTGAFSGALTGTVRSCSVEAEKLATNGQTIYTITVEPATGGAIESVDDIKLTFTSDPKTGTFSGAAIKEATGSVFGTGGDKQFDVQLGFSDDRGAVTLVIDSVPAGEAAGNDTIYQGFGGRAQIQYAATPGTASSGTVDLSLTFKP
jgi:outer membrane lipoprotein SlyB